MSPRNVIVFTGVVILLAGVLGIYLLEKKADPSAVSLSKNAVTEKPAPVSVPVISQSPSRIAMKAPNSDELAKVPPNPMAAAIGSDKVPPEKEIAILLDLFQIYRREFGTFPSGQTNSQFMNALRGTNATKLPIFPLDHPRLDPAGNLLDRWQQPYRFHPVSRDRLEIRSAGPDREIFTADDLVVPK